MWYAARSTGGNSWRTRVMDVEIVFGQNFSEVRQRDWKRFTASDYLLRDRNSRRTFRAPMFRVTKKGDVKFAWNWQGFVELPRNWEAKQLIDENSVGDVVRARNRDYVGAAVKLETFRAAKYVFWKWWPGKIFTQIPVACSSDETEASFREVRSGTRCPVYDKRPLDLYCILRTTRFLSVLIRAAKVRSSHGTNKKEQRRCTGRKVEKVERMGAQGASSNAEWGRLGRKGWRRWRRRNQIFNRGRKECLLSAEPPCNSAGKSTCRLNNSTHLFSLAPPPPPHPPTSKACLFPVSQ